MASLCAAKVRSQKPLVTWGFGACLKGSLNGIHLGGSNLMQICMVILSHFPLKKQCLDLGCYDIMTTVLSLEFGYFFFFLLVINFSQSPRVNILRNRFLGWHQKNGGKLWHPTFVGQNLPTTNFGWAESLSLGTFWTSRMGPDLDDAKVS